MEAVSWTDRMDEELERKLDEASKIDDVCKYFKYTHLREGALRDVSRTFAYLLAKDAAVRAVLP